MEIDFSVETEMMERFVQRSIENVTEPAERKKALRSISLLFIEAVVPITPKDTGRAQGGWTAMRGSVKATKGGYGRMGPGAVQGRRESSYRIVIKGSEAYAEILNGVPYIAYLELGSSQQAPAGFVRIAMRRVAKKAGKDIGRRTEAALRLANIQARREIGLRQGIGRRPGSGRLNIRRR